MPDAIIDPADITELIATIGVNETLVVLLKA
jgi:hypothetical protein